MISTFSAANSTFLTAPRIYYAMAYDGLFFQKFADVHKRFGTPAVAIIASGVWSAILASYGTFAQLTTYVVFIGWIFYALAAASIFAYRKQYPDAATRSYSVPGYPVTPILFIVAAAALIINTVITQFSDTNFAQRRDAAIGIGIVLLGIPAYFIWRSRLKKVE
jgi:APA family basic amino acid/polyamine antiporter